MASAQRLPTLPCTLNTCQQSDMAPHYPKVSPGIKQNHTRGSDHIDVTSCRPNISVEWKPSEKRKGDLGMWASSEGCCPRAGPGCLALNSQGSLWFCICEILHLWPFMDDPPLCSPSGWMGQQLPPILPMMTKMTMMTVVMMTSSTYLQQTLCAKCFL